MCIHIYGIYLCPVPLVKTMFFKFLFFRVFPTAQVSHCTILLLWHFLWNTDCLIAFFIARYFINFLRVRCSSSPTLCVFVCNQQAFKNWWRVFELYPVVSWFSVQSLIHWEMIYKLYSLHGVRRVGILQYCKRKSNWKRSYVWTAWESTFTFQVKLSEHVLSRASEGLFANEWNVSFIKPES